MPSRIGVSITAGATQLTMHARAREVLPDRLRHRDDRGLRRRVGAGHRVPLLARDRGDVDDPPVAALDHARDDRAVAEEDAVGVDPHHAPPLLVRDVDGRKRRARDARRADEDVDRAELASRRCATAASTSAERDTSPASASTPSGASASRSRDATRAPSSRQAPRDGGADAARPARDECHSPRESLRVAHGSRPSLESGRRGLRSHQRLPARDAASGPRVDSRRHPARRRHAGCASGLARSARTRFARRRRRSGCRRRSRSRRAGRSSPRASSAPQSSPRVPDELLLEVYTALRPRRATAAELEEWASRLEALRAPRGRRRSCAKPRRRTRSGGCSRMASRRFASRATRDLHLEQLVSPLPELGLVAANGPNDPEPELVVEDGVVTRMDGRGAAEFDVIDRFVVAHGLDLEVAAEAMALDDLDARPHARRRRTCRAPSSSGSRAASRRRSSRASSGCSTRSSSCSR